MKRNLLNCCFCPFRAAIVKEELCHWLKCAQFVTQKCIQLLKPIKCTFPFVFRGFNYAFKLLKGLHHGLWIR